MAVYGYTDYGSDVYGLENPPAYIAPHFQAGSVDYDSILVSWDQPSGEMFRYRLIGSTTGYPVNENDGDLLIDSVAYPGNRYMHTGIKPGSFHYYGLYVLVDQVDNIWIRSGLASCLAIIDKDSSQWMLNYVPEFFKTIPETGDDLTSDPAGDNFLVSFLSVLGWGFDYLHTQYDMLRTTVNDPMTMSVSALWALTEQLGFKFSPNTPGKLLRKAAANQAIVCRERGTLQGLQDEVLLRTGWETDVRIGPNILLLDDQAQFLNPIFLPYNPNWTYNTGDTVWFWGKTPGPGQTDPDYWWNWGYDWDWRWRTYWPFTFYGQGHRYQCLQDGVIGHDPPNGTYWQALDNTDDQWFTLEVSERNGSISGWELLDSTAANGTPLTGSLLQGIGVQMPTGDSTTHSWNSIRLYNKNNSASTLQLRSLARRTFDLGQIPDPSFHTGNALVSTRYPYLWTDDVTKLGTDEYKHERVTPTSWDDSWSANKNRHWAPHDWPWMATRILGADYNIYFNNVEFWVSRSAFLKRVVGVGHTDNCCLKVYRQLNSEGAIVDTANVPDGAISVQAPWVQVIPGKSVTASLWTMTPATLPGGNQVKLGVEFWDANGVELMSDFHDGTATTLTANTWTQLTNTVTVPTGAKFLVMKYYTTNVLTPGTDVLYIDDANVSLVFQSPPNYPPDTSIPIQEGIPVPWVRDSQEWNPQIEYQPNDIVLYQGYPFVALRTSVNSTPPLTFAASDDWDPLSENRRIRLAVSGYTSQNMSVATNETCPVYPFVEWYDSAGNWIARIFARNPLTSPISTATSYPDNLAFDSFCPPSVVTQLGYTNGAEGGTSGTTVTTGNSGGASGTAWSGVSIPSGCTVTYDNTHVYGGSLAYKFTSGSTAASPNVYWQYPNQPASTTVAYFYITAYPATSGALIEHYSGAGVASTTYIDGTAHTLKIKVGSSSWGTTQVFPLNTWVRLEVTTVASTTAGAVMAAIYVGDSSTAIDSVSITGVNTGSNLNYSALGMPANAVASWTVWMDKASDAGYFGPFGSTTTWTDASLDARNTGTYDSQPITISPWHTRYYSNPNCYGDSYFEQAETGTAADEVVIVPHYTWSVAREGTFIPPATGDYTFTLSGVPAGGGARVLVNGTEVINDWLKQQSTMTGTFELDAGHTAYVEFDDYSQIGDVLYEVTADEFTGTIHHQEWTSALIPATGGSNYGGAFRYTQIARGASPCNWDVSIYWYDINGKLVGIQDAGNGTYNGPTDESVTRIDPSINLGFPPAYKSAADVYEDGLNMLQAPADAAGMKLVVTFDGNDLMLGLVNILWDTLSPNIAPADFRVWDDPAVVGPEDTNYENSATDGDSDEDREDDEWGTWETDIIPIPGNVMLWGTMEAHMGYPKGGDPNYPNSRGTQVFGYIVWYHDGTELASNPSPPPYWAGTGQVFNWDPTYWHVETNHAWIWEGPMHFDAIKAPPGANGFKFMVRASPQETTVLDTLNIYYGPFAAAPSTHPTLTVTGPSSYRVYYTNKLTGRHTDDHQNIWRVPTGDFSITAYDSGGVYPTDPTVRSIGLLTGPADTQLGVTFRTDVPGKSQGLVFRYTDDNNYWRADRAKVRKKVAGTWTDVGPTASSVYVVSNNSTQISSATSWVATAYVYAPSSLTQQMRITAVWVDGNGNQVGTANGSLETITPGTWQMLSVTSTPPLSAKYGRVQLSFGSGPANTDIVYVDTVTLTATAPLNRMTTSTPVKTVANGTTWYTYGQQIPVTAGTQYTGQVTIKYSGTTNPTTYGNVQCNIRWYDSSGSRISAAVGDNQTIHPSTTYTMHVSGIAPAGAVSAQLFLYGPPGSYVKSGTTHYVYYTLTNMQMGPYNTVLSSSFEGSLDGWTSTGAALAISTNYNHDGYESLQISPTGVAGGKVANYATGFQDNDRMNIVLSGSTIAVYRNNVLVLTLTDSFNSTATQHGIVVE